MIGNVDWSSASAERFVYGERDAQERLKGACRGSRSDYHGLRMSCWS